MSVKVAKAHWTKRGGMRPLLSRLLAILALVLMPISMTGAPAMASDHGQAAAIPCDSHEQPAESTPDRQAHCTSCVVTPAPSSNFADDPLAPVAILADRSERLLLGILLDVATPPPRAA
jgi:hypothetical protein